jgi:hypothetical protein
MVYGSILFGMNLFKLGLSKNIIYLINRPFAAI